MGGTGCGTEKKPGRSKDRKAYRYKILQTVQQARELQEGNNKSEPHDGGRLTSTNTRPQENKDAGFFHN